MNITVTRAFLIKGVRQEVGSSLELPDNFARELIHAGKAERQAGAPAPAPAGPMTTTTAGAIVKGKAAAKEKPDAGE